jgi:hypothetical protein
MHAAVSSTALGHVAHMEGSSSSGGGGSSDGSSSSSGSSSEGSSVSSSSKPALVQLLFQGWGVARGHAPVSATQDL